MQKQITQGWAPSKCKCTSIQFQEDPFTVIILILYVFISVFQLDLLLLTIIMYNFFFAVHLYNFSFFFFFGKAKRMLEKYFIFMVKTFNYYYFEASLLSLYIIRLRTQLVYLFMWTEGKCPCQQKK
jgi:hypothetical protein